MKKHLLLGLAASIVSTWAASASAITHRSLSPVDAATRGIAIVRGGEVMDGCIGTVLGDRWVLVPREVYVNGGGRRCVGVDAASTTVSLGTSSVAVQAIIARPGDPLRVDTSVYGGGLAVTPVLLYLASPMTVTTMPGVASSVIAPTGGAMRPLSCVGRTTTGLASGSMCIGWQNRFESGVTTYRTRNNQLIYSTLRGAVFVADADVGAPCFSGNDLVGMTVAIRTYRPAWTNEDIGTVVGFAEMRGWVNDVMAHPPAPVVAFNPVGVWSGVHPQWQHPVVIARDGTIHGAAAEDLGRWSFDGRTLTLNWTGSDPEPLLLTPDNTFASSNGTFTLTPAQPEVSRVIGTWEGVHPNWHHSVIVAADGSLRGPADEDQGRWSFDGYTFTLNLNGAASELVNLQPDGGLASSTTSFRLVRTLPTPVNVTGTWHAVHHDWSDDVIINADGTYHRGNGDPGRWTFDGRLLTLTWTNWGPEPVAIQADGSFHAPTGVFNLHR